MLTLAGQVVRLWDLTVGRGRRAPPARPEAGLVVFSPDGKRVLRVTETAVRVYDTQTNQPVGGTLPHKNKVSAAAFSPDGQRVLTVSHQPNGDEQEGHVRVWETASGNRSASRWCIRASFSERAFSRDGRRTVDRLPGRQGAACGTWRKTPLWESHGAQARS